MGAGRLVRGKVTMKTLRSKKENGMLVKASNQNLKGEDKLCRMMADALSS